jgi:hypothetical protein
MKGDFVEPLSDGEKQIVDLAAQNKSGWSPHPSALLVQQNTGIVVA